jgi:hypothetical protein
MMCTSIEVRGRRRRSRPASVVAALVVTLLLGAACNVEKPVNDTLRALDDAQTRLINESANWREILQELEEKLRTDAQDTLREVQEVAVKATAAVTTNVQCTVDFLGQRMNDLVGGQVSDAIARIRAKVAGVPYEKKIKPSICSIVPTAVSLPRPGQPLAHHMIEIYGYNFDANPGIQLRLSQSTGDSMHPKALTRQSHYHMTILITEDPGLAREDVLLVGNNSRVLSLLWDGGSISDIPVAPPVTPPCQRSKDATQLQIHDYTPPHTAGDQEFGYNLPQVDVGVSLLNYGDHLDARIVMTAVELGGDTMAGGTTHRRVYTAPPGKRINRVLSPMEDSGLSYADGTWDAHIEERGDAALVRRYEAYGNRRGNDTDGWTRVRVTLNQIRVELVETLHCRP